MWRTRRDCPANRITHPASRQFEADFASDKISSNITPELSKRCLVISTALSFSTLNAVPLSHRRAPTPRRKYWQRAKTATGLAQRLAKTNVRTLENGSDDPIHAGAPIANGAAANAPRGGLFAGADSHRGLQ